ncbi:cysteine peptidase family C39 domain-containing protein [Tenacibaculum agarivorans]|uniref:cysteine peptidase family C39 domain-containing protein n=1 Tax=Tenacibaculum agarivorans TaxID=1908389 RepID=UPI00094B9B29|nr:cysteine peptidase family C39 domain-containing protein [Tenacibaculum agarivorans]
MTTFKTLDELNEFNKKGFEQVFRLKKIERPESPFKEGSFDNLKFNARPHEVFNLDWNQYSSIDFADKFLPYIKKYYKGKGMWMYDGAELFNGLKKAERKLFKFDDHKHLISLINYTYPKGVLAEERKDRVKIGENEVLTFIEIDESNSIDVQFKFGKRFKNYIKNAVASSERKVSVNALENKVYKTNKDIFQDFFKKELVHDNMMRYVLDTIGIEKEASDFAELNTLFPQEVVSFMENFTITGKFKARVFIEQSIVNVLKKINPNDGSEAILPNSDEIYIWLVHRNTSFIKVNFGINVLKAIKKEELTKEDLEELILNIIKAEVEENIISENKIEKAIDKGLGNFLLTIAMYDALESNALYREIFKKNPILLIVLLLSNFAVGELDKLRIKEHRWNPKSVSPKYNPIIKGDSLFNAQLCGFINGIIDEVKAIPEMAAFFTKISGSQKEFNEFIEGIKKLFEEGLFQVIIESATKEYVKALKEGNVERLYYNLAHDVTQIVSLLIGVFQLAKGISGFINLSRQSIRYIKRNGRKGIDKLKKLNKKEIKEVFNSLEFGSGGFLKYKKIISRKMIKQEHQMSCAAACITQLAEDNGIKITEKVVREFAGTTIDTGTVNTGIIEGMEKVFKSKEVVAKSFFRNKEDVMPLIIKDLSDEGSWIATIYPPDGRMHAVIVDKVVGKDVFIRDPWPLEDLFSEGVNGVEAIVNMDEFAYSWLRGGSESFTVK